MYTKNLSELDSANFAQLIELFSKLNNKDGVGYYQEVAIRIRKKGAIGVGFLFGKMDESSILQLRGVIIGLTSPILETHELKHVLKKYLTKYLQHKQPLLVMDAIDGLRVQGETDIVDTVLDMRHHSSPYVRGAVLRYMGQLYPQKALPLLFAALQDTHHVVRSTALDELDSLETKDAIPQIRPLLNDPHPHVRQAAQTAIDNLEELN